jgi:CcmD family protein
MIPNTLNYMIAGYIVVVIGISVYILSLVIRSANLKRKIKQRSEQNKPD